MKKILKMAFVAAFAAVAGYGVYTNQQSEAMSELMLANVEAIAQGESAGSRECWQTISTNGNGRLEDKRYCGNCTMVPARSVSQGSHCWGY